MKGRHNRIIPVFAAVLAAALSSATLASCSPHLGWGLVLWSSPKGPLPAGSIVPVYIKSNIEKLYVVGVPKTSMKIELPLWQIELFSSRWKAADRRKQIGQYMSLYMVAARDGLPIRESPNNDSSRVYRLREGQSVKILAKVDGAAVTTGGQDLPGDWYQVITDDGTSGYVFSYAMRIFDETKEGPPSIAEATDAASAQVDMIFSRAWRPEYFQKMIDDQRVNLDLFTLRYGLFADSVGHQIRIELPTVSKVFNYSSISQDGTTFSFEGTPLKIRIDTPNRIVATWTPGAAAAQTAGQVASPQASAQAASPQGGASQPAAAPNRAGAAPAQAAPTQAAVAQTTAGVQASPQGSAAATAAPATAAPATAALTQQPGSGGSPGGASGAQGAPSPFASITNPGMDGSAVFVELPVDPRDTIREEQIREQHLLDAFVAHGSQWKSPDAGRLLLFRSGGFTWAGHDKLPAGFLPDGAGDTGQIAFRLYLDPGLADWDGAFSMRFDAGNSTEVNLLYRFTPEGLDLAPAAPLAPGLTVTAADPRFAPAAFVSARQ